MCHRDVQVGTLNVQLWLVQSWESLWTSMEEGSTSGSPIMTMSWLSPRYAGFEVVHNNLRECVRKVFKFRAICFSLVRLTLTTTAGSDTSCTLGTWRSQAARCPSLWRTLSPLKTLWQRTQVWHLDLKCCTVDSLSRKLQYAGVKQSLPVWNQMNHTLTGLTW